MTVLIPEKAVDKNVLFFSDGHYAGVPDPTFKKFQKSADVEALYVTGLPIFRSGTFRDSWGIEHTYETEHMQMMKSNFDILKSRNIFKDVPVRAGHPNPFTNTLYELIGYVQNLTVQNFSSPVDGEVYSYLLADFEVLDSVAAQKIQDGLWRNRSSETGSYLTNGDSEFWPCILGFAYVDIPAVEGLNFSKFNGVGEEYAAIIDKEGSSVGDEIKDGQNTGSGVTPPAQPAAPANHGGSSGPHIQMQATHEFALKTGPCADFARVQAYITEIESANANFENMFSEMAKAARTNFVSGLVTDKKILAGQEEGLQKVALSLTEEAWGDFKAAYESAPVVPLLGNHAVETPPAKSADEKRIEDAQVNYDRHKLANVMTPEQIANTESAKILRAAGRIQ